MTDDLISRQAASGCEYWDDESNFCTLYRPSAERHGRWNELPYSYECSACGIIRPKEMTGKWHYCPNCGAKMDEVTDGE